MNATLEDRRNVDGPTDDEQVTAIVVHPDGAVYLHREPVAMEWLYATLEADLFEVCGGYAGASCLGDEESKLTDPPKDYNPWGTRVLRASGGSPQDWWAGTIIVVGLPDDEGENTPPPIEWVEAALQGVLPEGAPVPEDPSRVIPGQTPYSYHVRLKGGPWDGRDKGLLIPAGESAPPVELIVLGAADAGEGRYVRVAFSDLPIEADLTSRGVVRGAIYVWQS